MKKELGALLKKNKLHYTTDDKPGITRKLSGTHRAYFSPLGKKITDAKTLERCNALVLPPARKSVRISPLANGHMQATGIDSKGRKQYRYHPDWIAAKSETKFHRMKDFGKVLPSVRTKVKTHLNEKKLDQKKVLAAAITIMDKTGIRVGNEVYEELYGSFGLTTLRRKHTQIHGELIEFHFIGKKGVKQDISLRSKKLARIIQECEHLPGQELFEYKTNDGTVKTITSDEINNYIKHVAGDEFTAKDFRTRHGSVYALIVIHNTISNKKKLPTPRIIDAVAEELGNTRTVCKKYYIHPLILELYESGKIEKHFEKIGKPEGTSTYEKVFCFLLEKAN